MSLSSQVGLLATRIGTEIKSVRNNYVPNLLRGPIGGVVESASVSGTVSIDPALTNQRRLIMTGDTNIAAISAGADGQRLLFEVNASGGQRVITFDTTVETSSAVTTRTFTIPSGGWGYIALIYRANAGVWRLISGEPQVVPDGTPPSTWLPADHGLLAWSYDPIQTGGAYTPATNGQMFGTALKVTSAISVTAVTYSIQTAGSGFTSGRNLVGLYNSAGTLLAQTSDQSTVWTTAGGYSSSLNGSFSLPIGTYYVNFLVTASTVPTIAATNVIPSGSAMRQGRSANAYRGYWYSGVPTSLPNPRTTPSGVDRPMWVGLS